MHILKLVSQIIVFILLTMISQTGGVIYLAALPLVRWLKKRHRFRSAKGAGILTFLVLYLAINSILIPPLAGLFNRTALPTTGSLKPLTFLTPLLNRHYVSPGLRDLVVETAGKMTRQYPGSEVLYLDACFPFFDGFPLLPHLSHTDGKKLDLAFFYKDPQSGQPMSGAPSPIGYGAFADPLNGEPDQPGLCKNKGYWQYDILKIMAIFSFRTERYALDEERTRELIVHLASDQRTSKIFIEPHLKIRLKIPSTKIRYQGCHSVRHDDHIHMQVK